MGNFGLVVGPSSGVVGQAGHLYGYFFRITGNLDRGTNEKIGIASGIVFLTIYQNFGQDSSTKKA
jgi:hypothetical protein